MKSVKNLVAIIVTFLLAFSVTGCHKKNEIAVTVNGFEYTSGYYMCALINAYTEGQNKVYESYGDGASTAQIDYFEEKIDNVEFSKWVKNRALEVLKEMGTYQKLCKDNKLELSDDDLAEAQNTAYYTWAMYGYSELFEPNGVSWNTYLQFTVDTYYANLYFKHLYAEGGEKEIAKTDVDTKLYDNFIIANLLDVTFQSETADQKAEIKNKLDGYLADIKGKKKTFEEVYNDYNNIEETEDEEKTETEDDTPKPIDELATILGAKDTGYDHDNYSEIAKMKNGEVKLISKANNAGYLLVVKKDIKADPYYRENMDTYLRHLIKDDEFEKDMAEIFKTADIKINDFAVDRFKVKKIKEPSYS